MLGRQASMAWLFMAARLRQERPMLALTDSLMPLLRRMDPERAHRMALTALRLGLAGHDAQPDDPALAVTALGRAFRNPIGLAAGFDKNAIAVRGLARLGFGFVETGTVTPRPQAGNPQPRLFRLTEDRAVINRMGFNNEGLDAYVRRLSRLPHQRPVPVGANIGINKTGADPERDYPMLVAAVAPYADYITINVSSPNTPGLRDLQDEARLRAILTAVRDQVSTRPPLLVKLAPDLSPAALEAIVTTAIETGVDGLIVSNTTIARAPHLISPDRTQAGGLSGAPLFEASTEMLRRAFKLAGGRLTLIGAGGVMSGADALAKIRAGAHLVQLYSGLALEGPGLVRRIKRELAHALRRDGFASVREAIGTSA